MRKYFAYEPRFIYKESSPSKKRNISLKIADHQPDSINHQPEKKRSFISTQNRLVAYDGPYGFVWANNSCAFDAFFLLLIYAVRVLVDDQDVESFREEFPHVCRSILALARTRNPADFQKLKADLQNYVTNSPKYQRENVAPDDFVSIAMVYHSIFSYEDSAEVATFTPCVYTQYYDVPKVCGHIGSTNHLNPEFFRDVILLGKEQTSIQEVLIERDTWQPAVPKHCSFCGSTSTYRSYQRWPLMLILGLEEVEKWLEGEHIELEIYHGNVPYCLFGAIYYGGGHYRVRFSYRNETELYSVWENDGMKNNLRNNTATKCVLCKDNFPVRSQGYTVNTVLYMKRALFHGNV